MGYYASGAGEFTFDLSKVDVKQIEELLEKSECGCYFEPYDENSGYEDGMVYVCFPYNSYREDLWYDFLESLNGLLEDGQIEFDGDENCNWRFHYRNDKWYEDDGYIAYRDGFAI